MNLQRNLLDFRPEGVATQDDDLGNAVTLETGHIGHVCDIVPLPQYYLFHPHPTVSLSVTVTVKKLLSESHDSLKITLRYPYITFVTDLVLSARTLSLHGEPDKTCLCCVDNGYLHVFSIEIILKNV